MRKNIIKRTALTLAITVVISGMFLFKQIKTKAAVSRTSMTILEIEPGDSFTLTNSNAKSSIDPEPIPISIGNFKTANVTHITMPEYISKIDQINGKYDVIVIGRNTGQGDYSAPFQTKPTYLPYGKEVYNGLKDSKKNNILGMLNDTAWVGINNNNSASKKTYVEYYGENDITNKRADEILQNINSGQLVYVANEAISIDGTKLKQKFGALQSSDVFVKLNNSNINLNTIANKYNLQTTKKVPILSITKKPTTTTRTMSFEYTLLTDQLEQGVKVKLFLDLNGDALFKGKELVYTDTISRIDSGSYTGAINYDLDGQFVGNLTWKLEIETSDGRKIYKTDEVTYSNNRKIDLKVLQVVPNGGSNLYLLNNSNITSLLPNVTDYNLIFEQKTVSQFEDYIKNTTQPLNGVYNMIIIGFADSYGNMDFTSDKTISALKDYIKTGQSVMFTHDTQTYRYLDPVDISDINSKNITHKFRDIIGQARYVDTEFNPSQIDLDGDTRINHDSLNANDTRAGKISLGLTTGLLSQFQTNSNAGSYVSGTESVSVHEINEGLINKYPFNLTKDSNNKDKTDLAVAKTHYQWYQLNLEDPDVVPWYTLNPNSSNGYNKYDARNYYYTYSKGNITYSGTGHTNGYTTDEYKLFINTIVKAERGANHNPTINVTNLDNGKIISRNQDKLSFSFIPRDRDNDPVNYTVTVKNGNTVLCQRSANNVKQGQEVFIDFDRSEYITNGVNNLTVVIDAWDPQNAKAPTETRSVSITNGPNISLGYTKDANGYLVGDNATITVKATANKATEDINTTFSNISYNITSGDSDAVVVNRGANGLSFNDIHFTPDPDNSPQSKEYNFTLTQAKNGTITFSGQATYNQTGVTATQTSPLTINIPVAEGRGNITIHDNSNQLINSSQSTVEVYKNDVKIKDIPLTGSISSSGFSSGTYTFKLTRLPTGYVVDGSDTVTKTFSYDSSVQNIDFKVKLAEVPKVTEIAHGLYVNNDIQEGNVNLTQYTNATFGVKFTANYKNPVLQVDLDNLIRGVSVDTFKCFKIDSSGTLVPVTPNISLSNDGSNLATISFSDIDTNSSYLIQYSIKIGSNSSYTNKATLNDVSKTVNITCEELKDLF